MVAVSILGTNFGALPIPMPMSTMEFSGGITATRHPPSRFDHLNIVTLVVFQVSINAKATTVAAAVILCNNVFTCLPLPITSPRPLPVLLWLWHYESYGHSSLHCHTMVSP